VTGQIHQMSAQQHVRQNSEVACQDKDRLLNEYQATTEDFSRAVTKLHAARGTSSLDEYERLRQATEEARLKSEQARLALESHATAHRC